MLIAKNVAGKEAAYTECDSIEYLLKGKGLIIEFAGPTGSGKTTNCFHFSDFFKKQNLKTYVFKDIKAYLYQLKFYHRLHIYLDTVLFNGLNFLSYTFLLAAHGIYSLDSLYRYIKLCIFNRAAHQFMKTRQVDILLLDQWIIQGLWSATIFKAKSYHKLQNELKQFYFKTQYVLYFDIDEETACERTLSRGSGRSRFDQMDNEKRLAELKRYNHYLRQLYENSDCKNKITFSTKASPVKNAEDFFHHLEYALRQKL